MHVFRPAHHSSVQIRRCSTPRLFFLFLSAPVQQGGQLVQFCPRLVHRPGQLRQVDLNFPQLRRHMGGGGLEGGHQRHILGPEQLHRAAQPGGGGRLQLSGPFVGVALDVPHPVPELGVGLRLRPEPLQLSGQPFSLRLECLQPLPGCALLLQLGLGLLPEGGLRLQPRLQLPDLSWTAAASLAVCSI